MKRLKTDPDFALRITNILFYAGMVLLVAGLAVGRLMGDSNICILGILAVCGIVCVTAGLVVGFSYVKCPSCEGSLMLGGRIPGSLPDYCPHCGEKL